MLPVAEMPERIRRAIRSIEQVETFELVEGSNSNQTEPKRNKKKPERAPYEPKFIALR